MCWKALVVFTYRWLQSDGESKIQLLHTKLSCGRNYFVSKQTWGFPYFWNASKFQQRSLSFISLLLLTGHVVTKQENANKVRDHTHTHTGKKKWLNCSNKRLTSIFPVNKLVSTVTVALSDCWTMQSPEAPVNCEGHSDYSDITG